MNERQILRRLQAHLEGAPIPHGATLHHHIADDENLLIVVFVRMGGETNPWAIATGYPHIGPDAYCVAEPRSRDAAADLALSLAQLLLPHLRLPGYDRPTATDRAHLDEVPLPQVWVPNATHMDMFHHLAYAYRFVPSQEGERRRRLEALGRASGWLFRVAQLAGQQVVLDANAALRAAYTFPSDDLRQGHTAYLLALLDEHEDPDAAERLAVATALDPDLERELDDPVARLRDATGKQKARIEQQIRAVLEREVSRRFSLTVSAINRLRRDPRRINEGVAKLMGHTRDRWWWDLLKPERVVAGLDPGRPWSVDPETDRSHRAAAGGYLLAQYSDEYTRAVLAHDDYELVAEAVADGDGFAGVVERVWDEGPGRSMRPVWEVEGASPDVRRLRVGSLVELAGVPGRSAVIRSVDDDGQRSMWELEFNNRKRAVSNVASHLGRSTVDENWVGEEVTFIEVPAHALTQLKHRRVWNPDRPGRWLMEARA